MFIFLIWIYFLLKIVYFVYISGVQNVLVNKNSELITTSKQINMSSLLTLSFLLPTFVCVCVGGVEITEIYVPNKSPPCSIQYCPLESSCYA